MTRSPASTTHTRNRHEPDTQSSRATCHRGRGDRGRARGRPAEDDRQERIVRPRSRVGRRTTTASCRRRIRPSFRTSATARRISPARRPGEMGGTVTRASEPAFYADKIGRVTLDDKLSASGSFALTKTTPGGGVFFGFFRAEQPGGGRPADRLARPEPGQRAQRRPIGRAAHHRPEPVVRHLHHPVPPRQVPAHADPQRRHPLPLDARLRPPGRRRQGAVHVHPPQRRPQARRAGKARPAREPQAGGPPPLPQHRPRSPSICPRVTGSRGRRSTTSA